MRRIYILCLLGLFFFSGIQLYAYDFQSGGIYYNILDENSVEVTSGDAKYEGNIVIPEKVTNDGRNYNVTTVGNYAFLGCSALTSITIPNSVKSIAHMAFKGCIGLTSISIPNSLTRIGSEAFVDCSGLISITIPSSVHTIGSAAFYDCSGLISINVENGNTRYDSRNGCNAIIETATNTLIAGCKNTIIHKSVTNIGSGAFHGCSSLISITIPASVTNIGSGAFYGCSGLSSITIPNSVTSIGSMAFYGCSGLTYVNIPNSVTNIEDYLFQECRSLTSIIIPSSVTSIGIQAFAMSNAELYGTNGAIVNITLKSDADISSGANTAALKSQVFTATDGTQYKWKDLFFSILVNENTDIGEILLNNQNNGMVRVYNLTGFLMFSASQNDFSEKWHHLPSGVYIVNGQKMIKSESTK